MSRGRQHLRTSGGGSRAFKNIALSPLLLWWLLAFVLAGALSSGRKHKASSRSARSTWATTSRWSRGRSRCPTPITRMPAGHGDRAQASGPRVRTRSGSRSEARSSCRRAQNHGRALACSNPRRTNTGRRDYSGKPYFYKQRRHHLVFAVDRNGKTIEEWLQHDNYLAPDRGSGLGEMGRGPHKILHEPVRQGEAHLDRRRRHASDHDLQQRRQAPEDDGRAGRSGAGREPFQPSDGYRVAA